MMSRHSRQSVLMVPTTRGKPTKLNVAVGRFYQIIHSNLPPRTPPWLRSVRIVMVRTRVTTIKFRVLSVYVFSGKNKNCPLVVTAEKKLSFVFALLFEIEFVYTWF